jgi:hypothetical protein
MRDILFVEVSDVLTIGVNLPARTGIVHLADMAVSPIYPVGATNCFQSSKVAGIYAPKETPLVQSVQVQTNFADGLVPIDDAEWSVNLKLFRTNAPVATDFFGGYQYSGKLMNCPVEASSQLWWGDVGAKQRFRLCANYRLPALDTSGFRTALDGFTIVRRILVTVDHALRLVTPD